ncbi:hypothetical protein CEF21_19315 [Bacillus sp. FJAT-42376]|uniref:hypothetical protein n=1 Tax=Bacillus sp. FJAT-42376 TaxID=2014076 RepID=UPI000F4FF435|nr:hypothetical protein [Bacillus sp. FJAT-42376]AZB44268.1 hypothetical protein CEF21_19315 [Bacillus sp. FJAT-42376]
MSEENQHKGGEKKRGVLDNAGIGFFLSFFFYIVAIMGFQNLYLGPILHVIALFVSFGAGYNRVGQGLLIAAGVIILLVAACFGFVFLQMG